MFPTSTAAVDIRHFGGCSRQRPVYRPYYAGTIQAATSRKREAMNPMNRPIRKLLSLSALALAGASLGAIPADASSSSIGTSNGGFAEYGQEDVGLAGPQCIVNTTDAVLTLTNQPLPVGSPFT